MEAEGPVTTHTHVLSRIRRARLRRWWAAYKWVVALLAVAAVGVIAWRVMGG